MIPKFRIWDTINGSWIYPDDRFHLCIGKDKWWVIDSDKPYYTETIADSIDSELVQSTGLKDKNNVEIFEGDIVKVQSISDGNSIQKVEHSNGSFWVGRWQIFIPLELEVIGNAYENPELINGDSND